MHGRSNGRRMHEKRWMSAPAMRYRVPDHCRQDTAPGRGSNTCLHTNYHARQDFNTKQGEKEREKRRERGGGSEKKKEGTHAAKPTAASHTHSAPPAHPTASVDEPGAGAMAVMGEEWGRRRRAEGTDGVSLARRMTHAVHEQKEWCQAQKVLR